MENTEIKDTSDLSSEWRKYSHVPVHVFAAPLIKAGIIPANTKRFILDVQVNEAIKLYVEQFPNGQECGVIMDAILKAFTPENPQGA